jgi:DNA-binding NtrC family response regulator
MNEQTVHREEEEVIPAMMIQSKRHSGPGRTEPSILLASDSERHGSTMHRALRQHGFAVEFAGDYAQVPARLEDGKFDVVLLEVTGEHAVEPAVAAALAVKRGNAQQFVGYLADASLETSGLAGDAVMPRSAARVQDALRRYLPD